MDSIGRSSNSFPVTPESVKQLSGKAENTAETKVSDSFTTEKQDQLTELMGNARNFLYKSVSTRSKSSGKGSSSSGKGKPTSSSGKGSPSKPTASKPTSSTGKGKPTGSSGKGKPSNSSGKGGKPKTSSGKSETLKPVKFQVTFGSSKPSRSSGKGRPAGK
jgi:hypothetical protein